MRKRVKGAQLQFGFTAFSAASDPVPSASPGPDDGVIDGTYRSPVDLSVITAGVKI